MNRRIFGLLLTAGLLLPVAAKADDVNPAWEFASVGTANSYSYGYSFGEVFVPTQNITVDYLGYFYDASTGMTESHPVALYDVGGNPLAFTTITDDSTAASPNFLYNSITPVTLLAGQIYVIDGASGNQDPFAWDDNGFSVYAPIIVLGDNADSTYNGGAANFSGPGVSEDGPTDGYWGADFGYEEETTPAVPEPSSLLLLGSGLAALAGVIKRKLRA
jgi:hypothetical protein